MKIKPRALQKGSTIGIIAPAGPVDDFRSVEKGMKVLESLGFNVLPGRHILKREGYLAGSDDERLADLMDMFTDRQVEGIMCLRGGYGSIRLLSKIGYRLISQNPKIFMGYSDITALCLAIRQKCGLVTFSGPMVAADLGSFLSAYTLGSFIRAVTCPVPAGLISTPPGEPPAVTITPGKARGELTGGNLSMITATLGTPYEIETKNVLLVLEEVNEEPYRIDRMLQQLLLGGKLTAAAGIVFGRCVNCEAKQGNSPALLEVIRQNLGGLGIPCFYGFATGHAAHKATWPVGVAGRLDADKGLLFIEETATRP
jgi:muramoyltetrapeptide carboxypeptidase